MRNYLLVMLIAATVSYLGTPMALGMARRLRVLTPIRSRDIHTQPIPRLGGIAMFAGITLALLVASQMTFLIRIFESSPSLYGIFTGAAIVLVVGVADDIWDLHWLLKLAGQLLAAVVVAWFGIRLTVLPVGQIPIESPTLQILGTVFFVVLTMNAINFVDGLDGLAAGVAIIGGMSFFIFTYWATRTASADDYSNLATLIMATLIGACVGFIPFNFHPAKIFMGDAGAMLIGLLLSSAAIAATAQPVADGVRLAAGLPAFMPIILPIAVLSLPLLDLFLAVVRRTARGVSPFSADRGHLHHKLLDIGYSHRRAVLVLYLWTAIIAFGVLAFAFFDWAVVAVVDVVVFVGAAVITLRPWARRTNLG